MSEEAPSIRLTINGEPHQLPAGMTVQALLEHFSLDGRHTAVERNRTLVPKAAFATTPVEAGDVFEIVSLVGGG